MSISLTSHARKRLSQRGLSFEKVKQAIEHGIRQPTLGGATYIASRGIRLIVVGNTVITVYKPPKK